MKQIYLSKKAEEEEPVRVVETRGTRFYPIKQYEDDMPDGMFSWGEKEQQTPPEEEASLKSATPPQEQRLPADDISSNDESVPTQDAEKQHPKRSKWFRKWWWLILPILLCAMMGINRFLPTACSRWFDPMNELTQIINSPKHPLARIESTRSFTEIRDTMIKDVSLRLYLPHNAEMSLHLGAPDEGDTTIVYISRAADIRADNGEIVGAFVLKGEPKAWGLSKKGYCAVIDGEVIVGVEDNSPLFEEATAQGGYFFRQYPLVKDGRPQENAPRGRYIRRALCHRGSEIFMVESNKTVKLNDFATSLAYLGVENAIYLVGSSAFGWAIDQDGKRHQIGNKSSYHPTVNTSYVVWRKK